MDADEPGGGGPGHFESFVVTAATLRATLGVPVLADEGAPPTFRFQQPLHFAEGLWRRGVLDLAARRFRTTLWAGDHRCIDHLEVDDLQAVTCEPEAHRLIVEGGECRIVLNRQGALTVVPLRDSRLRATRRGSSESSPAT